MRAPRPLAIRSKHGKGSALTTHDEVQDAARRLVEAFGAHDTAAYFDAFSDDASFVFPNVGTTIGSRAEYQQIWATWEADGFRVEGCESSDQRVQVLTSDVAVFTHSVATRLAGEAEPQHERETIVFRRSEEGRWLGVHEHLSAAVTPEAP
jgi:uncharacterized protein (TIGR02246 family)